MKISQVNTPTFQGYDARPLKALCMTTMQGDIPFELAKIGKQVGFDVYVANNNSLKKIPLKPRRNFFQTYGFWAQDAVIVTPDKDVVGCSPNFDYHKILQNHLRKKLMRMPLAPEGGNIFYVKDIDGKDRLLAGYNSKCYFDRNPNLQKVYGVKQIDYLPQMDYHLDLFIRPLDKKRILVADDNLMIKMLESSVSKLDKAIKNTGLNFVKKFYLKYIRYSLQDKISYFKNDVFLNRCPHVDSVVSELEKNGYSVQRVPGRLYSLAAENDLVHDVNYMNAIVTKDKNGDLVYMTNKSKFDDVYKLNNKYIKDLDISLERAFVKCLAPFVKEENIHFISGKHNTLQEFLSKYYGGLHCLVTEIPK